jgi:hypothetical protein
MILRMIFKSVKTWIYCLYERVIGGIVTLKIIVDDMVLLTK